MRLTRTLSTPIAVGVVFLAACGGDADPRLQVERDTVGDTVIVRTVSGSEWGAPARLEPEVRIGVFEGEDHYMFGDIRSLAVAPDGSIYVMDSQVPALRKYAPDGTYIATFGREGEGPGEYKGPDGGLTVLDDGRVVLRDPRNGRLQVYSSTGEPLATWPIRGNFNTSRPLVVDTAGRIYTLVLLDPEAAVMDWQTGLVAVDTESGDPVDTIPSPTWDYEPPQLIAQRVSDDGTSTSVNGVPFGPEEEWTFSPLGYMVGGLSTRYAIDLYRPDAPVLRIERIHEPVRVKGAEKDNAEARTRWNMRRTQPDWTWNGPAIPDEKPPFRDLFVGNDGRIWVLLHQPGERIPDDQVVEADPDDPNPRPANRWREPTVFDVFEPDGTYLGQVRGPTEMTFYPNPVFHGDNVWAVVRDELDVEYLVRFRVSRAQTETSTE